MYKSSSIDWEKVNDFLLSVSSEQSIDRINSRIIKEIPELIHFGNFGAVLESRDFNNPTPEINSSVNFDKKWVDLYNSYYKKVVLTPPFNENDFSATKEDWSENKGKEFIDDFLMPQDVRYSVCLHFFRL